MAINGRALILLYAIAVQMFPVLRQVPGKRQNRRYKVLELDLSGLPTYRDLGPDHSKI